VPITLRDIPEDMPPVKAREHMRTHVYLNVGVTDRNSDGVGNPRAGYRKWVTREEWYSATDEERAAAIQEVCATVAKRSGVRP
jgi:hypothetical protein